jgi:hypothetical protein
MQTQVLLAKAKAEIAAKEGSANQQNAQADATRGQGVMGGGQGMTGMIL